MQGNKKRTCNLALRSQTSGPLRSPCQVVMLIPLLFPLLYLSKQLHPFIMQAITLIALLGDTFCTFPVVTLD